ncbi:LSM4 [Symbiodinium microadriaticum]|nr:LSM4 [Symbiodinium microadriaticum]
MVELKNGETYSGVLASCDGFMNLHMRDIVCTSRDGERFWKIPECYVRGNSIKYLRLPDEVIDMVKDEPQRSVSSSRLVVVVDVAAKARAAAAVVEGRLRARDRSAKGAAATRPERRHVDEEHRQAMAYRKAYWCHRLWTLAGSNISGACVLEMCAALLLFVRCFII